MKQFKIFGALAVLVVAVTAFNMTIASATTLEIGGVPQNKSVSLVVTQSPGTTELFLSTDRKTLIDTCTAFEGKGTTEGSFSGSTVGGKVSLLTTGNCSHTTDTIKPGKLVIQWTSGTNGAITASESEITTKSTTFGTSIICKTGEGTKLGTVTGTASGNATVDVNAVLDCGLLSAVLESSYLITSPAGLGVVS